MRFGFVIGLESNTNKLKKLESCQLTRGAPRPSRNGSLSKPYQSIFRRARMNMDRMNAPDSRAGGAVDPTVGHFISMPPSDHHGVGVPSNSISTYPPNSTGLAAVAAAAAGAASGLGPGNGSSGSVNQSTPQQNDVDDFLRKKRKAREHKACYPCRQRKVKCDLSRPCQTCRDRDHPQLCAYHPPNKRQNIGPHEAPASEMPAVAAFDDSSTTIASSPGPHVMLARGDFDMLCRRLSGLEQSLDELRRELQRNAPGPTHLPRRDAAHYYRDGLSSSGIDPRIAEHAQRLSHSDVHGFHTRNVAGDIVHVGGSSIPAMLYALGQESTSGPGLQEMLGKTSLPLFALDNESATYPFVDLWGLPHGSLHRANELAKALPADAQMRTLVTTYKDIAYTVFPGIVDPARLEHEVQDFISQRASDKPVSEHEIWGRSYTWLAMLFAVLACGAQCSLMQRRERELTSQVYICCSVECLRFTNFLGQANLESCQALTAIGNALTNNLNAGTAWMFHGLTIRIAQSLGLHQACPPSVPPEDIYPRSKVWWGMLWLDSLMSIGYDRPSSTHFSSTSMPMPQEFGPTGEYHGAMYRLAKVALDVVRDRALPMSPHERYDSTIAHRDAIFGIMNSSAEYLRNSRVCSSARETLEHWGLYLHTSYSLAEVFRPAISPRADPELARAFRHPCVEHLSNTVEAFLGLNNITALAKHSWAAMHRGLSAALLLGILGEHSRSERARSLVARFMTILGDFTNHLDPHEVSGPVRRGLAALRKLDVTEEGGVPDTRRSPGMHKLENGFPTLSPVSPEGFGFVGDDSSPHSLLHSILWGKDVTHSRDTTSTR